MNSHSLKLIASHLNTGTIGRRGDALVNSASAIVFTFSPPLGPDLRQTAVLFASLILIIWNTSLVESSVTISPCFNSTAGLLIERDP